MSYPFSHSWQHERKRLAALESGMDANTIACLETIGVAAGWRCLEVGAGAGSIARWLCERVGADGHVVATDLETGFLNEIDAPNLEVRRHDIRTDELEKDAFDLVHARKVLEHLPAPEAGLARMVAATRSGGHVLVQDGEMASMLYASTSDRALFERGYRAFVDSMVANGFHADLGAYLGQYLRRCGLVDVQMRGWSSEWTGHGDRPSVYLATFQKIRDRVVDEGRISAAEADRFLAEIQSPDFHAITAVHFAAWGRRP